MEQNRSSKTKESQTAFAAAMRIKLEENRKALKQQGKEPFERNK